MLATQITWPQLLERPLDGSSVCPAQRDVRINPNKATLAWRLQHAASLGLQPSATATCIWGAASCCCMQPQLFAAQRH